MRKSSEYPSNGLGLPGILTIIFVLCKLFDVITWSWWWVFSPVWISIVVMVILIIIVEVCKELQIKRR